MTERASNDLLVLRGLRTIPSKRQRRKEYKGNRPKGQGAAEMDRTEFGFAGRRFEVFSPTLLAVLRFAFLFGSLALGADLSTLRGDEPKEPAATETEAPLPGLKRLAPNADVWLDPVKKQLVMRGEVVLRRGPLELFACLKRTKEHEAIVAVDTKAYVVHAGLIACGAESGNPAKFQPEFTPARGTEIEVWVEWTDAAGKTQRVDAREWIKDVKTGKPMAYPWVFGGSGFWTDPQDGKQYYQAEDGDFICISNFPSAMLDLPVESSNANSALMFEAFTDRIPPDKTKVLVYLVPKKGAKKQEPAAKPAPGATSGGREPT
ncbi:MAG: hypothetical protein C0483_23640 [Pirellula sp.]|nr:hypothetical protein [Pirellula sp.]